MAQIKTAQEAFLGLFTEATPEGLPQGASPRSINTDYIVGSVGPRPGKKSRFIYDNVTYESAASFTQSVGDGEPWSGGSVTLNGTPCTPTFVFVSFDDSLVSGNSITYTKNFGGVVAGPVVVLYGFLSLASAPHDGAAGQLLSVTDNSGDSTWTELTPPTAFSLLFGSLDPSEHANFQFFAGVFPSGLPAPFSMTITLNFPPSDFSTFTTPNTGLVVYQHVTGYDEYDFHVTSPTAVPVNDGASITTAGPRQLVSYANLFNFPTNHVPTDFGLIFAGAGSPSISAAKANDPLSPAGTYSPAWDYGAPITPPAQDTLVNVISLVPENCGGGGNTSQTLEALNFSLDIPVNIPPQGPVAVGCGDDFHFEVPPSILPIFGIEVRLTGSQSDLSEDAELLVQLKLPDGTLSPETKTTQMPLTTGTVTLGSPTDLWGFTTDEINAALLDDPNFTVTIVAQAPGGEMVTFSVTAEVLVVFSVPDPPPDINYLKSFEQTGGELNTLALGSNGVMYLEDAINNPDVLTPLFTRIFPNSFAQSVTQNDREYIAISNLINGTDVPRVYSPPNFDRLSQVGPGAAPAATGSNVGGTIPIVSITQPAVQSDPENPGHISGFLWSAGPGSTAQGNVLTVYYARSSPPGLLATPDPDLKIGVGVTIAGADTANPNNQFNGQLINGNYIVTSVGEGIPPGAQYGRWYFTVTVPVSQYVNQADHIEANAPDGTYQVTTATLTASSPIPNMQIGSTMQISGTGGAPPAGYDGSWLVTDTLNAAELQITSTELTSNTATYGYTLISGVAPTLGSKVTVSGTLNGQGIFNVSNATITSTSPGVFSIQLVAADIASAAENGIGIIAGTKFKFEPGQPVGTVAVGSVVVVGTFSSGIRKVCYSFLTRNGFLTQPSPIFEADIIIGSTGIAVTNLLTGPDNVVARVVHFTGANGGQFYNNPNPVVVTDPITGQKIVNDSTWIMDNTTTSAVFSFSDETLLAADEIDIQGNNLFNCYELGSCVGFIPFAGRLAAIGEQNKVFLFRNYSFDGGVGGGGTNQTYPAGWTVDPTNGAGGSVVPSLVFGNSFQISNSTGSTQAIYGMITQGAYKDEFMADIIGASTTYSVRVTAAVVAPVASGNLVIDLFSASSGGVVGSFTLPLNSLTTSMQLISGTLLTNMLSPVPQDLLIRIYATNIPDGATVQLDREEVFPTEKPNLDDQIILSYAQNFEAFDRLTGVINPLQNPQPIKSAFVHFDTLVLVKTNSMFGTTDNGTTEPTVGSAGWGIRTISQSVGTTSIYGVTTAVNQPNSGEDWAIIVGRAGAYIYTGGEPIKLSEEIQSIVNQVNWQYGHTLWVLNDIINRRILWGAPLKTYWLNPYGVVTRGTWLPEGVMPDNTNPTTPNVVLDLNYKQLITANELSSSVGVHPTYRGQLIASDITRKWALWTIKAPAAAFLSRPDKTNPVFFGNSDGNGKIYELLEGLLEDDGSPFAEIYCTSPFLPRENAQAAQIGVLRYGFSTMTLVIDGVGTFRVTVMPNYVDGAGTHALLPDLTFPVATYGDAEVPMDEEGNRLFVQFSSQCVGSAYVLSDIVMLMSTSAFAPFSGRNG